MSGLRSGWGQVHYHIRTHPQIHPVVPSSIRKLLSRSQKLLIDLNSKCHHQQNFPVQFILCGWDIEYPFLQSRGKASQNELIKAISHY